MTRRVFEPKPMASSYGWAYAMIRDNPEVRALFVEACESGVWDYENNTWLVQPMSQREFTDRVRATDWYQEALAQGRIRL